MDTHYEDLIKQIRDLCERLAPGMFYKCPSGDLIPVSQWEIDARDTLTQIADAFDEVLSKLKVAREDCRAMEAINDRCGKYAEAREQERDKARVECKRLEISLQAEREASHNLRYGDGLP